MFDDESRARSNRMRELYSDARARLERKGIELTAEALRAEAAGLDVERFRAERDRLARAAMDLVVSPSGGFDLEEIRLVQNAERSRTDRQNLQAMWAEIYMAVQTEASRFLGKRAQASDFPRICEACTRAMLQTAWAFGRLDELQDWRIQPKNRFDSPEFRATGMLTLMVVDGQGREQILSKLAGFAEEPQPIVRAPMIEPRFTSNYELRMIPNGQPVMVDARTGEVVGQAGQVMGYDPDPEPPKGRAELLDIEEPAPVKVKAKRPKRVLDIG